MLLLKQSLADQSKCIIHEKFINKFKVLSVLYDSGSFWDTVLCNNATNSQNATGNCDDCADEKKVVVNINLGKNVFCKEWKYIDNKFQVVTQSKCIGELLESLESEWDIIVLTHINAKEIQSAQ